MRRVAILMGGRSSEHGISLASARSVADALDPARSVSYTHLTLPTNREV